MIRGGFLNDTERQALLAQARDGLDEHRVGRRANAIVLLDRGWSCAKVAKALLLDDDTVRTWHELYREEGIEGLRRFEGGGGVSSLSPKQETALVEWIGKTLPRSTREVGAFIQKEFEVCYESRSGLIALMHRVGLEYRKPEEIGRKLDPDKQRAFIAAYSSLQNHLAADEAVLFADAVHPTHAARPVGCWAPRCEKLALDQSSGRDRLNIHGAINLETGETRMIEAETVDANSTIRLLASIEALYPTLLLIHVFLDNVFLDNARYHHAKVVKAWLARPGCRIKLHFIPAYSPHLNPIERLWGLMHKNVTHNRCHATITDFADATLSFLRDTVPKKWAVFSESVSDNFRIINPTDFRVLG
jgi:transposase